MMEKLAYIQEYLDRTCLEPALHEPRAPGGGGPLGEGELLLWRDQPPRGGCTPTGSRQREAACGSSAGKFI
jgi:hypothetical protein